MAAANVTTLENMQGVPLFCSPKLSKKPKKLHKVKFLLIKSIIFRLILLI